MSFIKLAVIKNYGDACESFRQKRAPEKSKRRDHLAVQIPEVSWNHTHRTMPVVFHGHLNLNIFLHVYLCAFVILLQIKYLVTI